MEKQHIVNRMLVSACAAFKYYTRGNTILAACYYGQYVAEGAQLSAGDAWTVADDPKVPHITREDVEIMFEEAHTLYEALIVPAYKDAANN